MKKIRLKLRIKLKQTCSEWDKCNLIMQLEIIIRCRLILDCQQGCLKRLIFKLTGNKLKVKLRN